MDRGEGLGSKSSMESQRNDTTVGLIPGSSLCCVSNLLTSCMPCETGPLIAPAFQGEGMETQSGPGIRSGGASWCGRAAGLERRRRDFHGSRPQWKAHWQHFLTSTVTSPGCCHLSVPVLGEVPAASATSSAKPSSCRTSTGVCLFSEPPASAVVLCLLCPLCSSLPCRSSQMRGAVGFRFLRVPGAGVFGPSSCCVN